MAKIDQLQVELSHFDIIAFSETWLSPAVPDEDISFLNYQNNTSGLFVMVACSRTLSQIYCLYRCWGKLERRWQVIEVVE
ncbi:MAG: hypothetical protein AB2693_32220 [Candidatus Thiodiazotropha sp.]